MSIDLSPNQLRAIVAVADLQSFTAASARLHMTQPALSRTVIAVEGRLGCRLFLRTTRSVLLTQEGAEFVDGARRLLDHYDAEMDHFRGFVNGTLGRLHLLTLPSLAATVLPPILASFRMEHPEVEVTAEDAHADQVRAGILAGKADLALTVGIDPAEGLMFQQLAVDSFYCIFPKGHRFTRRARVRWRDLAEECLVAFDDTSSLRRFTDVALAGAGVRPARIVETNSIEAVAGFVASGVGVSAVSGLVLPLVEFAHLCRRPLVTPTVERSIGLLRNTRWPLTRLAAQFSETLVTGWLPHDLPREGVRWISPAE